MWPSTSRNSRQVQFKAQWKQDALTNDLAYSPNLTLQQENVEMALRPHTRWYVNHTLP